MATAKMVLGALPGVDRPALAAVFPTAQGTASIMLDVGANVDSKPHNLEQWAVMGEIYSRAIFGAEHPRVGLLSIGEEESKGNELTRAAHQLLKQLPLQFVGNVEGRDLYNGNVDVIVCDGFIGNVALKVSEGLVETVGYILKETLRSTITRQVGLPALAPRLRRFQEAPRLLRIRRRAAAGHQGSVHRQPRIVERARHQERHSRGRRVCQCQYQRCHRARADLGERPAAPATARSRLSALTIRLTIEPDALTHT